jgi:uncharacterized protein
MKDKGIILFLKYPEAGKVKTRIGAELGNDFTVILYRKFVSDILKKLLSLGTDILVYFTPEEKQKEIIDWLGYSLPVFPQSGNNVGERMSNAFREQFKAGYRRLILIGSDIPHIPSEYLLKALDSLESHSPELDSPEKERPVIGPASDGGYYLIGFDYKNFLPSVFEGINWSTDSVFNETLKVFEKYGLTPSVLPVLSDIDTADDLRKILHEAEISELPETARFWYKEKGRVYGS